MRRFIAYIVMALTIILAIGVSATPVFSKINAGREFTNSYEVVYQISDSESKSVDNNSANEVASEMRNRLDKFNVEDYSVKVQGNDTISVSFAAEESEYEYIVRYLHFSGGNYSLIGQQDEQFVTNVFDNSVAYITKVQDTIPYVIIPISDKTQVEQFVKTVDESAEEEHENAEGEEEEEGDKINIYLAANWDDADTYESVSKDPHMAEKIIMEFSSKHIWYEESSEEHTELQYLCGTADEEGNYDLSKLKLANLRATYLCNMFNASSYELEVSPLFVTESATSIIYNSNQINATAENLLVLGTDVNIAWSTTLISSLVAIAIISLLFVVFYKLSAVAAVVNTLGTVYLTFVVAIHMGALINIPALIGAIIVIVASLFGSVFYLNKFKDEIYKGRSLKKANQEASKKSNLATIDIAVILAFTGLMLYVLGGVALKPMGVMLFFGALFTLGMNLIIFKIMMYLLANTTSFQNKYSYFAIEEKNVPNVMKENKDEYVAPFANTDYTKKSKYTSIVMGLLTIAAVAVITVFGALNGSPLNVENATKDNSVIYVSINSDNKFITDEESFKNYVLKNIKINDANISEDEVTYQKVTKFDSDALEVEAEPYHVFVVDLSDVINPTKVEYSLDNGENYIVASDGLAEAIEEIVMDVETITLVDKIEVSVKTSHETVYTPNQGYIALATGIAIVGASIYLMFRFRISRGLSALVTSASATAIAYGFIVATRLGTTALTAVLMPAVAVTTLMLSLFFFSKEKEMLRENRENLDIAKRGEIMKKSIGASALSVIISVILVAWIAINYFGFGLSMLSYLFIGILVGVIAAVVFVLTITGPLAHLIDKLLSKIHLPKFAKKEKKSKIKLHEQPKTSEPEERIYIGIND